MSDVRFSEGIGPDAPFMEMPPHGNLLEIERGLENLLVFLQWGRERSS